MNGIIDEAIDRMQEECGEVVAIAAKIKRFGIGNYHPVTLVKNRAAVQAELTDLYRRMREFAHLAGIPWREIGERGCKPKEPPEGYVPALQELYDP